MRFEVLREFDPWKGELCTCPPKYSLQPYTGCPFSCLYCYATSYIRNKFQPKKNFLERLERDLKKADKAKLINMSTSSDPYPPIEEKLELTRKAIELILAYDFKLLITTKGKLVARDADLLSKGKAAVMVTITTLDEALARKLEPGAPSPKERVEALASVAQSGVPVGARVDPLIPGLNDDEGSLEELLRTLKEVGVKHVTFSTYKAKPDNFKRMVRAFPYLKDVYARTVRIGGYRYLPESVRREILGRAARKAEEFGLTYAFCREGIEFPAPSCDGSHLLELARPRRGSQ